MDVRALLSNRWVWLAGAAAAGVGLVVFIARRRGSSQTNTSDGGETAGYGAGGVGYFDSVATDVATQLGQYQTGWQSMFDEFTAGVNERLGDLPTSGETGGRTSDPAQLPPGFPTDADTRTRTPGINEKAPGVPWLPNGPVVTAARSR